MLAKAETLNTLPWKTTRRSDWLAAEEKEAGRGAESGGMQRCRQGCHACMLRQIGPGAACLISL
jgi:hypothetical protein